MYIPQLISIEKIIVPVNAFPQDNLMSRNKWMPLALFFLAVLVYSNALAGDFVLDDLYLIVNNTLTGQFSSLFTFFLKPYWAGNVAENNLVYRPLVNATFVATKLIAGNHAFLFKLTNVIFHAANTILVYFFFNSLTRKPLLAFFTATLFAVHPIQSEAVNGIAYRTDLIVLFLALSSFLLYLRKPGAAFVIPLLLAFFSKESAVTLIAVYPFLDLAGGRQVNILRVLWWPGLAVGFYFIMRFAALGSLGVAGPIPELDNPIAGAETMIRVLTAFNVLGRYLMLLIYPFALSADYSFNQISPVLSIFDPLLILGLSVHLALIYFLWWSWKRQHYLYVLALALYFLPMALIANIFMPIPNIMAERFLYLPSIGILFLVGLAVHWIYERAPRTVLAAFLMAITALSFRTFARNYDWRSEYTLFSAAEKVAGRSARVHFNLANAEYNAGNQMEAIHQYQQAIEIYPAYVLALSNLCVVYANQTKFTEARSTCEAALHYNPDFKKARESLDFIKAQGH